MNDPPPARDAGSRSCSRSGRSTGCVARGRVFAERRLARRQALELAVETLVLRRIFAAKRLPGFAALPSVDGQVTQRIRAVTQEFAPGIARGAPEEPCPGAFRPVVRLELDLLLRHDDEFPQCRVARRGHQRGLPASHVSASATVANRFIGTPRLLATVSANFIRSPPALTST